MKTTKVKQHYIDFGDSSLEQFISDYRATKKRSLRKAMVEALDMQTNDEWLMARQGHITASVISGFLSGGRKKDELFGETAKGIVNKYLDEKEDGCFDDMESRTETYYMKQGLVFEKRALQLFKEKTGIKNITDEIGFISENIKGIDFGCSPDALILDESGKIQCVIEIKSRTGAEFRAERENLGNKATVAQMQMAMHLADCPRAILIMYDIVHDTIQYIEWTRGMAFKRILDAQIDRALEYINRQYEMDNHTDLKTFIVQDTTFNE